jgi:hypothetical protein
MDDQLFRALLTSQFHAALAMLRGAVESCPDSLWNDERFANPTWRVAYHALFYAQLYLTPTEPEFKPMLAGLENANFMSAPLPDGVAIPTREEIVRYAELIEEGLEEALVAREPRASSGFDWISFNRAELHVYNVRHIQHHAGQLIERLRAETGAGVPWVGRKKAEAA